MSLNWRDITLDIRDETERIRLSAKNYRSSHAFASLMLWRRNMGLSIAFGEGAFIVKTQDKGEDSYFFPCGEADGVERLLRLLPSGAALHYIGQGELALLSERFAGQFEAGQARGDWESLYDRRQQEQLAGKHFRHVRRDVRNAMQLPGWSAEPLTRENIPEARIVQRIWREKWRSRGLADSYAADEALEHFEELGLRGMLTRVNQEAVGFAIGSFTGGGECVLHICKAADEIYTSATDWVTLHSMPEDISIINREEDLGLAGLREHKLELRPTGFYKIWSAVLKQR